LVRWAEKRSFLVRYRRYLGRSTLVRDTPTRRFTTCRRLGTLRALLLFRFKSYSIEEQQVRTWRELLNNYEVGSEEMAAFGRLIDGLRAAGVTPIIVQMPVTNDWLDLHPAGRRDFERFEKAMDSIAHQRDVPDVDLMAPFLSIEEFADPVHLNGEGQARFTNLLADVIAELPTPARA
jgi:lysophospholipase L1-like esterase